MSSVHPLRSGAGRLLAAMLVCTVVSGCGLARPLAPVSVLSPEVELVADPDWPEVDWAIQIRRPTSDRMRDSERLFVRVSAARLQAYPGTLWLDQVPDMLQSLTLQALEDSGRFQGVGRAGALRARFALATELRRFDGVDDGGPDLSAELVVQANLIVQRTGQVVASRTFQILEPSTGKQLDPLVAAFERALEAYFMALLPWILEEGRLALEDEDRVPRPGRRDR